MEKIIIIDEMHPGIIPQLESLGFHVDYQPQIDRAVLLEKIDGYYGLIVRSKTVIDSSLLDSAQSLRFVARAGAGVDNLDESAIRNRNIQIINAPEGNRDALAEHVVGMLLNLLHHISAANEAMRYGQWDREAFRGMELGGKTVGIIGCGNMGCAFAKRLSSFDCRVLGYDKYLQNQRTSVYQPMGLNELFRECDILSLHVPLTNETRGFYNYTFFKNFRKPIILINSARGEILPLEDLVNLLKERRITGACLDVFEKEPFHQLSVSQNDVYEFLRSSPQVLLTPHVAGWSHESYLRINEVLVDKLKRLRKAKILD